MSTPPEPPVDPWATPQPRAGSEPSGWSQPVTPAPPAGNAGEPYFGPDSPYGAPVSGPSGAQGGPYGVPYGQYGAPYGTAAPAAGGNGLGTAALILGILAVVLGIVLIGAVFGVLAIVLGLVGRARARRGQATNGGVALWGALLGLFGVLIAAAVAVTLLVVFAGPISDYRACISRAGGNVTAQQVCNDNLRQQLQDRLRP